MKKTTYIFSSSQEVLYLACTAAWNLCSQHLVKFTKYKPFYTAAIIGEALDAVEAAKELTASRQTIADRKIARINLAITTRQVQYNWQMLKTYITKAFDKAVVKARLEAAGASLYNNASADNWTDVITLIDTANTFIALNLDQLTSNENMPAAFQTTFLADGNTCKQRAITFTDANFEKETATANKRNANNAIYLTVIDMLKDGQQIFKEDAAIKKQFTFSYLVSQYRGEGSASLKGYVTNNLNQPLQGVTIISADQKYKATTNKKGYYRIRRIAEGTYPFSITCPGYASIEQSITFTAGTASNVDFEMVNVMKKVA